MSLIDRAKEYFNASKPPVFCVDCKHLDRLGFCNKSTYVSIREADIVTGLGAYKNTYRHSAKWERSRYGECGVKGKLFEPKETL